MEFCLGGSPRKKLTSKELKRGSFSPCKWEANQIVNYALGQLTTKRKGLHNLQTCGEDETTVASFLTLPVGSFSLYETCTHSYRTDRAPLLNRQLEGNSENGQLTDLEHSDAVPAANVGFGRVFSLAKPEAANLVVATIALLIASTSSILIFSLHNNSSMVVSSASERVVARLRKNLSSHLIYQVSEKRKEKKLLLCNITYFCDVFKLKVCYIGDRSL